MCDRFYSVLRYTVAALSGMIIGGFIIFLAFAAELSQGTEFIANGKRVLCIRTE